MSKTRGKSPLTGLQIALGRIGFRFILEKIASRRGEDGGAYRDRTDDLKLAKLALSQLSYGPTAMHGCWRKCRAQPYLKWWAE